MKTLSRQEALSLNPVFAAHVAVLQDLIYNPVHQLFEPELMYVEDSEQPRFVSQEECDEWNREAIADYEKLRDKVEVQPFNFLSEAAFRIPETEIETYSERMALMIEALNREMDWGGMVFLMAYSVPWLSQDNNFLPVKSALSYLKEVGATKDYTGGFLAGGENLAKLTKAIFWITRCNASITEIFFTGKSAKSVLSLCKHGNLHISFYDDAEKKKVSSVLEFHGMVEIPKFDCTDEFSEDGSIDGREIIV